MGNDPSTLALLHDLKDVEKHVLRKKTSVSDQTINGWSGHDHSPNIKVAENRLLAKRRTKGSVDGVRGRIEYTKGIHFFQVHWNPATRQDVVIGIATNSTKLTGNTIVIGADDQSVGWNLVTKEIFFNGCATKPYPPDMSEESKIPKDFILILNMDQGTLSFKSHDQNYGVAESGLKHIAKGFHIAAALGGADSDIMLKYLGGSDDIKPVGKISSPLSFHEICGKNAVIGPGSRKASRSAPHDNFTHGTILTNRPLQKGELFRVRLDKKTTSRWQGSFQVGVTTNIPAELTFPEEMGICDQGKTWIYTGQRINHKGFQLEELNGDLRDLKEGETAGVKFEQNKLQFYVNGYRQVSISIPIEEPLYGFVDIYGQASAVSIIDADYKVEETVTEETCDVKEDDSPNPKTVDEFFDLLVSTLSLMSRRDLQNVVVIRQAVNKLHKVHIRALTAQQKILAAERLAKLDGAKIIANYMVILKPVCDKNPEAATCYNLLRDLCFNYSDDSYLLCNKLGEAGILEECISDMRKLRDIYQNDKKNTNLLKSGMGILANCVKASGNETIYMQFRYMDIAKEFTDPNEHCMWACLNALFTMSYLYDDNDIALIKAPKEVAETMIECLKNAVREDSHRHGGWDAIELIIGISNLTGNPDNCKTFVRLGVVNHLVKMIEIGSDYEKEHALDALCSLVTDRNKKEIVATKGLAELLVSLSKSKEIIIKNATVRVLSRIQTTSEKMLESRNEVPNCKYMDVCRRFIATMDLSDFYFDVSHDRCFCIQCHSNRGEKTKYARGKPRKNYGVPVGWCRFGLGCPPKAKALNVFTTWHRAYHGTKKEYIKTILEVGEIVPAGRAVVGGVKVKEEPGHFNDDRKPRGFDTKQVFLSPSIRYSGVDAYAKPSRFYDDGTKRSYLAKVAFQAVINPESYQVGEETIGATTEIDPGFRNEEMEWSTNQQGSSILYGLLIKLERSSSSDKNSKNLGH